MDKNNQQERGLFSLFIFKRWDLSWEEQNQLVDALLKLRTIRRASSRSKLIKDLPVSSSLLSAEGLTLKDIVSDLIEKSLDLEGGVEDLFKRLVLLEGNTRSLNSFIEKWNEIQPASEALEETKVLFMTINVEGEPPLDLGTERRQIKESLARAEHGNRFLITIGASWKKHRIHLSWR